MTTVSIRSIPLSAAALAALLACSAAHAQSSVTLYGVMETGLRYSTNNDAAGHGKAEMAGGYYSGSRFGLRGSEDLGNGLKAVFHLVSGFAPDTGVGSTNDMGLGGYKPTTAASSRLFGRQAYVGLEGGFGALTFGRQENLVFNTAGQYDALSIGNLGATAWHVTATGVRIDNAIKYVGDFNGWRPGVMVGMGEQAGAFSAGNYSALSLNYANGPFTFGGAWEQQKDLQSVGTRTWTTGGSVQLGPAKLMLGYINYRDGTPTKNDLILGGVKYDFSSQYNLVVGGMATRQRDPDGLRYTGYAIMNYVVSKRTWLYVGMDYTHQKDAGTVLAAALPKSSQTGVMVGMRHGF